MSRGLIITDIDGTLFDASHRNAMLENDVPWDEYHAAAVNDRPVHDMIRLVNALHYAYGLKVIAVTGKTEKWRELTKRMFVEHCILIDDIWMRPNNDFRPNVDLKLHMLEDHIAEIMLLIDDDDRVIEAFNALGVTTLHCTVRR